ncbi:MAG: hypothetical protein EOO36_20045 [Cytophagaceae bacterium]|nr:MAG: hypothetical protein EOO36_20045 [Cytophagaceae bacterium]
MKSLLLAAALLAGGSAAAQSAKAPAPVRKATPAAAAVPTAPDNRAAVRETDIQKYLYTLAGDYYRGREAGTLDELKASAWLAEQARAIGAQPASV